MTDDVLLPVRPVAGWEQAGPLQQRLALAGFPLVLALVVTMVRDDDLAAVLLLSALVASCAATARVIRPYPPGTRQRERRLRHGTSAVATALGGSFFLHLGFVLHAPWTSQNTLNGDGSLYGWLILLWTLAFLLGVLTVAWGVVAVVVRAYVFRSKPGGGGAIGEDELPGGPHAAGRHALVPIEQRP